MEVFDIIKTQPFFVELAKKRDVFSTSQLFLCEDELTANEVLILTALMLEFPTYAFFDTTSAEYRRISSGVDVDVKLFPRQERLLVSDSEEIVDEAYIKPINLPFKIFIIRNIDNSTDEAQNKLLKIIEEPPKNVRFLLSAKSEKMVLPTIRSRCEKVRIPPLSEQEISKFSTNKLALRLGRGYIGKTKSLESKENLETLVDFAVSLFSKMKSSKDVIVFSKRFQGFASDVDLLLETICLCVEDMLKMKCEMDSLCVLARPELEDVETEFSAEALCEISSLISRFRERLAFNGNFSVCVDNLLLKMLEVKYICK